MPDGTNLPDNYKTGNLSFEARVYDGKAQMKSDNICGFEINEDGTVDSADTSFVGFQNKVTKREEPAELDGVTYEYQGVGGNVSYMTDVKDGKGALVQRTYTYTGRFGVDGVEQVKEKVLRTNFARIIVDAGEKFASSDNNMTLEAEVYANEENSDTNFIRIYYSGSDGKTKNVTVTQEQLLAAKEANGGNPWVKIEFKLKDIDLTSKVVESKYMFSINTPEYTQDVNYIHSLTVRKTVDELTYDSDAKTIKIPVSDTPISGSVRTEFELCLPKNRSYMGDIDYNSYQNGFAAYIVDGNGKHIARLEGEFDSDDISASKLYACGYNKKEIIYAGDIINRDLTVSIETNRDNKTYSMSVFENGTELGKVEDMPLINSDNYADMQYIAFDHNADSTVLLTEINNISVYAKMSPNYMHCKEDYDALDISQAKGEKVKANFELPVIGSINSSTIEWESSDSNIIAINENIAVVNGKDTEQSVTLTATVTNGEYSLSKDFEICVAAFDSLYSNIYDIDSQVKVTENENGVSAKLTLTSPGTTEPITFIAVSYNAETGKITDRKIDTQSAAVKYGSINYSITNLAKNANDEVKYYLWDKNNVSLVNLAPTDMQSLDATAKVKAVVLEWEPCYDDNEALVYKVYRDDVYIGETADNKYTDRTVSAGTEYRYRVVPFDTNDNKAAQKDVEVTTRTITDYWTADAQNGIKDAFASDPARAAYVEKVTYKDGTNCVMAPAVRPAGGVYGIYYHAENVKQTDREVVVTVTYLDNEGSLTLFYNKEMPEGETDSGKYNPQVKLVQKMEGTNTWKTAVYKITDAQFRKSPKLSAADFGFCNDIGKPLYIKKVEVIKGELYD